MYRVCRDRTPWSSELRGGPIERAPANLIQEGICNVGEDQDRTASKAPRGTVAPNGTELDPNAAGSEPCLDAPHQCPGGAAPAEHLPDEALCDRSDWPAISGKALRPAKGFRIWRRGDVLPSPDTAGLSERPYTLVCWPIRSPSRRM